MAVFPVMSVFPSSLTPFYRVGLGITVVGLTAGSDRRHCLILQTGVEVNVKSSGKLRGGNPCKPLIPTRESRSQRPGDDRFLKDFEDCPELRGSSSRPVRGENS